MNVPTGFRNVPISVLVNGAPVTHIEVTDRGLLYGDGLFETMALREGAIRLWPRHLRRLAAGCERLRIEPPAPVTLEHEIDALTGGRSSGVVKVIVTRGRGARGYGARRTAAPTRVLSLHDDRDTPTAFYREGIRLRFCATRLGCNRDLAGIKHLNRLEQVLARLEADDGQSDEGIMFDESDRVISGTMTNVFLVRAGRLITPALSRCGVEGVMRGLVLESAAESRIEAEVRDVDSDEIATAQELFVTNALIGIWPVRACAGQPFGPGPVTRHLMSALVERGVRECAV
ncbi:MAG: aminodeoxychorismate lyase [Gammaproteobacteria bacterium]